MEKQPPTLQTTVKPQVEATFHSTRQHLRRGSTFFVTGTRLHLMNRSFRNRETQRYFEGHRVASFQRFSFQAARRLVLLDSAETLQDLAALRGNRLEALRGNRAGQHSIRINAQWRICFRWSVDGPLDVGIVDYH